MSGSWLEEQRASGGGLPGAGAGESNAGFCFFGSWIGRVGGEGLVLIGSWAAQPGVMPRLQTWAHEVGRLAPGGFYEMVDGCRGSAETLHWWTRGTGE